jgi:hypothetical protein
MVMEDEEEEEGEESLLTNPSSFPSLYHNAQDATMPIDQLGDLDHEKLITAGLLLQGVRKRREGRRAGGREGRRKEGIETG